MQLNSVGVAGEVRCVVTGSDGEVKTDTGYQKNLILNQGLDFFGGGKGSVINERCVIGSGNSSPAITQTKLDAFIAIAMGTDTTSDYSYVDKGDNLYRMWEQKNYRFTGLADVNISEVGLVSTGTSSTNYYLTTRALIKDNLGAPTSISVKTGETLDIYYKIHKVVDTRDKAFVINVLDGNGGSVPYNVVVRPINIGSITSISSLPTISVSYNNQIDFFISNKELEVNTTASSSVESGQGIKADTHAVFRSYVASTYKMVLDVSLGLNEGSTNPLRKISFVKSSYGFAFAFFPFQVRFGRVSDDAPITKNARDTLTIPFEISWGRYEGVL